jgi:hypothetical protein
MSAGLTVQNIGSYPAFEGATSVDSGLSFTNGVYTQSGTQYVAGYLDGESRAKMFYTDGAAISLPTLVKVTRVSQVDAAGTTKTGGYYVVLSWPAGSAGSPDLSSVNSQIFLDQFGILLFAGTAYG